MILFYIAQATSNTPPPQDIGGMIFQIIIGFVGGTAGTTFISKLLDAKQIKGYLELKYKLEAALEDLAEEKEEKALLEAKLVEYTERQTTGVTNRLNQLESDYNALKEEKEKADRQLENAKRILKANNINISKRPPANQ